MRTLVAGARVGRLATLTSARTDRPARPHVVPCCFALVDDTIYSAVDGKPKTTPALQRLANVRAHPQSCLLVDHYADDWTALWWVRVDGSAARRPDRRRAGCRDRRAAGEVRAVPTGTAAGRGARDRDRGLARLVVR